MEIALKATELGKEKMFKVPTNKTGNYTVKTEMVMEK